MYSDVSEHLSEFATLKAIGYSDRRLFWVVLQESLILSVFGFIPGLVLALGVYEIARAATVLPIHMTLLRLVVVFPLTVLMCAVSGAGGSQIEFRRSGGDFLKAASWNQ